MDSKQEIISELLDIVYFKLICDYTDKQPDLSDLNSARSEADKFINEIKNTDSYKKLVGESIVSKPYSYTSPFQERIKCYVCGIEDTEYVQLSSGWCCIGCLSKCLSDFMRR